MLEIPGRQRKVTDQGWCRDQGIRHAGVVLPSKLTPAPGHRKIKGKRGEQPQQSMDFSSSCACRMCPAASSATVMIERYLCISPASKRLRYWTGRLVPP